jgi:hypothetical protein
MVLVDTSVWIEFFKTKSRLDRGGRGALTADILQCVTDIFETDPSD